MPDINLLDGKRSTDKEASKKPKPVVPFELSRPDPDVERQHLLKKPSSIGLWLGSLFRGRVKKKPELPRPTQNQRSAAPGMATARANSNAAEPEDIFADIPAYGGGPVNKPRGSRPESAAPAGVKPGAFGPLPKMPAWEPTPSKPPAPAVSPPRRSVPTGPGPTPRMPLPIGQKQRMPTISSLLPRTEPVAEEPGVNLLPEEMTVDFNARKKLVTLGLVALAAALFVGVVDVSLLLWKETQVKKTKQKEGEVALMVQRIKALESEQRQAIALRSSIRTVRALLNTHVYWTKYLEKFERYTLPSVFYASGITASFRGGLSLTGSAPDIETVNRQLAAYQQATDFIKSAKIENIMRNREPGSSGDFNFIVDLEFVDDVYVNPVDAASGSTAKATTPPAAK